MKLCLSFISYFRIFKEALKTLNGFYAEPGEMPTRAERSQVPETILPAVLEAAAAAGVSVGYIPQSQTNIHLQL